MPQISVLAGRLAAAFAFVLAGLGASQAEIAAPTGEVILTIDGNIANTNADGSAQFDLDMLMAMPAAGFETSTTWTDGMHRFDGVPLKALLDAVGAEGGKITATALNNYAVDIPIDAIEDAAPIVAYHIDGETFSRRDKGPLWILFPYDSDTKYQTELVYGWSIWQLSKLTIAE
ncbi:molybdopterin-dependent oxidoreductase [Tabrizicola sp. TH137]|uniref:molybdopterin-dependent oxidoreductase n=1 Tax=Tabrizicola sp. TH137 TaxID=2067452 RepID=UPI0020B3306B|nr:molybdopterin-dependent oxidoreductase [Tabrizicola sp. TH137]